MKRPPQLAASFVSSARMCLPSQRTGTAVPIPATGLPQSQALQERHTNETGIKAIDNAGELSIDELDIVNGGCKLSDAIDRVVAIYHYVTGTITSPAQTLP